MNKRLRNKWKRISRVGIIFVFALIVMICAYICVSNARKINKIEDVLDTCDQLGVENSLVYYAGMASDADNTVDMQRELVRKCESCASVKEVYPKYSFSIYTCLQEYVPEQTGKYMLNGSIPSEDFRKMSTESWYLDSVGPDVALSFLISNEAGDLRFSIPLTNGEEIKNLQPNQILLGDAAEKSYEVGDKIFLVMADESRNISFCSCEIVGFIDEDERLFPFGTQNADGNFESLFVTIQNERVQEKEFTDGHESKFYGVVSSIINPAGQLCRCSYMSEMIIFPEDGFDIETVQNELHGILTATDRIVPYNVMRKDYGEKIEKESSHLKTQILISIAIPVVALLGFSLVVLGGRRKQNAAKEEESTNDFEKSS